MKTAIFYFSGIYAINFQSKDHKVPFNVYINGALATSYTSTTQSKN